MHTDEQTKQLGFRNIIFELEQITYVIYTKPGNKRQHIPCNDCCDQKQLAAGQHVMPIDHHYVGPSNRQTNGCLDATRTSTYMLFVDANIQRTNQDGHETAATHVSLQ